MKKAACLIFAFLLLFSCAEAGTETVLPGSRYTMIIPDGMEYSAPRDGEAEIHAWSSDTMEIDYFRYPKFSLFQPGEEQTLVKAAESRTDEGIETEIRNVSGIEMLVSRLTDETDGAPGIGYLFLDGNWVVEIFFWYATQEAADLTEQIILSIKGLPE